MIHAPLSRAPTSHRYTVKLACGRLVMVAEEVLDWLYEHRPEHGSYGPAYALVAVDDCDVVTGAVR